MNFKPTKWKVIVSVLIVIALLLVPKIISGGIMCGLCEFKECELDDYDKFMLIKPACDCECQTFSDMLKSNLSYTILPFAIIYIIWSLFESKKKVVRK